MRVYIFIVLTPELQTEYVEDNVVVFSYLYSVFQELSLNLGKRSIMIIVVSLLNTFEASSIF